jgi:pyruvate/2-oxoglutarate dehydrogenase complex dihydrolipoamide dehydrogenase (E3) component
VPAKTLASSARAIRLVQRGSEFGFDVADLRVDMARVMARKNAIVAKSREGVEAWMRGSKGTEVIIGDARFVGPATLEVGRRRLSAPRIFLSVGGRAVRPALPGIASVTMLDNVSVMELDAVVERSARLLPRVECLSLAPAGERIVVGAACGNGEGITGSHVLLAVGRQPNTDELGLELAGIRTDARGYVEVDDQCRTSAEGVWAVGDCNGRGAFTHTSWNDHEIVVANLFDGDPRRIGERCPCYALFIDPALGRVGMTETEALASGKRVLRAKIPMQRVGRAREAGATQGFMKVLVDADTQRILGAAILGMNGDEVVHSLLNIIAADQPYTVILRAEVCASLSAKAHRGVPLPVAILGARMSGLTRIMVRTS